MISSIGIDASSGRLCRVLGRFDFEIVELFSETGLFFYFE